MKAHLGVLQLVFDNSFCFVCLIPLANEPDTTISCAVCSLSWQALRIVSSDCLNFIALRTSF